MKVDVEPMTRRCMDEVLEIEQLSFFDSPWTAKDFRYEIMKGGASGQVAVCNDEVVGYIVYKMKKLRIELLSMAVHPSCRRCGAGQAMIEVMRSKLQYGNGKRRKLTLFVRETNLDAQLFFKSLGFIASRVVENAYDGREEDAYEMEWQMETTSTGEAT